MKNNELVHWLVVDGSWEGHCVVMAMSWGGHGIFVDGRGERVGSWETSEHGFPLAIAPTDQCQINAKSTSAGLGLGRFGGPNPSAGCYRLAHP